MKDGISDKDAELLEAARLWGFWRDRAEERGRQLYAAHKEINRLNIRLRNIRRELDR